MSETAQQLKVALPNKGRLADEAIALMNRAGIRLDYSHERKLFAVAQGGRIKVLFLRAADIPEFLHDGVVHLGVTGLDIVRESDRALEPLLDLGFGRCRLVIAAPEESPIRTRDDLPNTATVATSFPRLTERYFAARGVSARLIHVTGAAEITPHLGVADLIADITSTGSTLTMNGLREVDTVLESTAHIVARQGAREPWLQEAIDAFVFTLRSVVAAQRKRYLLADVPRHALDEIRGFLPGIAGPTVVEVAGDPDTVAIHVVVDDQDIYDAVARLKRLGGRGILVMPIDRMVP